MHPGILVLLGAAVLALVVSATGDAPLSTIAILIIGPLVGWRAYRFVRYLEQNESAIDEMLAARRARQQGIHTVAHERELEVEP